VDGREGRLRRRARGTDRSLARAPHLTLSLGQHLAEDARDLVELGLSGDERRRDLDDGIAAVVGTADEAGVEQRVREIPAEEALALLVRERLARLLVLDQLERIEEPGPTQVPDDREVEKLSERGPEGVLVFPDVLDDPLALDDVDVLERDRFDTCRTSGTSGSKGARSEGIPVIESAPIVVP
jgi:hypothetical protein